LADLRVELGNHRSYSSAAATPASSTRFRPACPPRSPRCPESPPPYRGGADPSASPASRCGRRNSGDKTPAGCLARNAARPPQRAVRCRLTWRRRCREVLRTNVSRSYEGQWFDKLPKDSFAHSAEFQAAAR
jgi:hypothetical protein